MYAEAVKRQLDDSSMGASGISVGNACSGHAHVPIRPQLMRSTRLEVGGQAKEARVCVRVRGPERRRVQARACVWWRSPFIDCRLAEALEQLAHRLVRLEQLRG